MPCLFILECYNEREEAPFDGLVQRGISETLQGAFGATIDCGPTTRNRLASPFMSARMSVKRLRFAVSRQPMGGGFN